MGSGNWMFTVDGTVEIIVALAHNNFNLATSTFRIITRAHSCSSSLILLSDNSTTAI